MSLSPEIAPTFQRLCAREPLSAEALEAAIARHLEAIRAAAEESPFVDVETAEEVAKRCRALLPRLPLLDRERRAMVQAACLYFAEARDGEHDLHSVVGFDDDLDVVRHVMAEVEGR